MQGSTGPRPGFARAQSMAERELNASASTYSAREAAAWPQVLGKRPNYSAGTPGSSAQSQSLFKQEGRVPGAATPLASPAKSEAAARGAGSVNASPAKPRERERAWDKLFSMEFRS